MAKKQVPKQRGHRLVVFGFLAVFAAVIVVSARDSHGSRNEPAVREPTVRASGSRDAAPVASAFVSTGWSLADTMLINRDRFRQASGEDGFPEWGSYTDAYFRAFTARREAIITWSASQLEPPEVVFIGQAHLDMAGGNSPEFMAYIARLQQVVFGRVQAHAPGASVIAIENSGTDEIVTSEILLQLTRRAFHDFYATDPPEAEVRALMGRDPQAATRAVLELRTPVICGEEWPIDLETRLLMRGPPDDPQARNTLSELIDWLNHLRSEIILVRTLEYLRRVGGSRGIILQGDDHRPQVEALAPSYHITFTGIPMD